MFTASLLLVVSTFDIKRASRIDLAKVKVLVHRLPSDPELRRWMEAYLAYCRRQMDAQQVDTTVAKVVNSITGSTTSG